MIGVNYTTTMTMNQTQTMMHGALKHFHPGLMGSTQYFVADNFNHLLVMSAAFFTMLIDGALDCYREHVGDCVLREGNITTEEECLGKVKEKLREVMAGLDHISQQIPKIDDILFDTSEKGIDRNGICVILTFFP